MHPKSTPSRLQFVRVCGCGCGQPTLLAYRDSVERGWVKGQPLRFINRHHVKSGEESPAWRGGRYEADGYVFVYVRNHPRPSRDHYVFEHRLVMEQILGRYLESFELVHHKNKVKNDNRPENLALTDRPEHARLHGTTNGWSRKHSRCLDCGTTDKAHKPHEAFGYCRPCYHRWRYHNDPAYREKLLQSQRILRK